MREIFTYGSVGGASGDRCFYPEGKRTIVVLFKKFYGMRCSAILFIL